MPFKIDSIIVIILLWLISFNFAHAEEDYALARKLRQQGQILSLERIFALALANQKGEIIEAEFEQKKGRYIYEIEILDANSQVWELKLDAKTGQLIEMELDD